ncbi:MAG: ion transporter [Lachnospiraceae bacterium]|nr:ion transporter [Lachnospiraceae bacterium]
MDKKALKKRVYDIINIGKNSDVTSRSFDFFIVAVILINLAVTFLLTFDGLKSRYEILHAIETITIVIFTIEYLLRLWTADLLYPDRSRAKARLSFAFSLLGLIDLLTILPFFLPMIFPVGAVALRIFRVFRIFRLFRINTRYDAFNVIIDVLSEKKNQLLSSVAMVFIFMLAASLCMYGLEHDAQPENFSNAFSGIWWSVSTLLTIGYGDIYPVTIAGRVCAIIISFLGVLMVAIPTGILSAGFVEQYSKLKAYRAMEDEVRFETVKVTRGHSWNRRLVSDVIEEDEAFREKRVRHPELSPEDLFLFIRRGSRTFVPDDNTVLHDGDVILMVTDIEEESHV